MRNKICIVTHVTASLGQAGADALAKAGAKVVVHDASFADTRKRRAYAKKHPGLEVSAMLEADSLVDEVAARHKRVDVVISNTSLTPEPAAIEKTGLDDLRHALDVLAVEPFVLAKAASRHMKKRKSGKIIFITSDAPRYGLANHTIYCTAQGTANALMVTLAQELADSNIQVNAIAPAMVPAPTYFPKEMMGETTADNVIVKKAKGARKAKPAEAAALIAFLAGAGSDFLIGEVVPFAGGWI